MSILISSLNELQKSKKLCELLVENPDDFIFCQIIDFNEDFTLVKRILSDSGESDGYSMLFTDNIRNIAWEGELLLQLEILVNQRSKNEQITLDKISNIHINNHFFKTIRTINSLFGHISVYETYSSDDFYFGQVNEIDEEYMLMRLMGDKSIMDDKRLVLRLEDIGRIDFGGIYDENMLRLHQIKKKMGK
jgi:hypothetical protein